MTRIRPTRLLAAVTVVPLVALAVAGCGNNNDDNGSTATSVKPASGSSGTIRVADSGLGKLLVDSQGDTLYLFEKDSGTTSACSGGCATQWPPLRASGKPTAGSGAQASSIGTIPRSDGKPQVTYNGHPLYTFAGDNKAGDANGQGINAFGALWYVLSPSGDAITTAGSNSSGGNGY